MHVAGHKRIGDYVIDTHGAALIEPVYQLLQYVLSNTTVHGVLLERDQNFPEFSELVDEINAIRGIAKKVQPALAQANKSSPADAQAGKRTAGAKTAVKGGRDLRAVSA
jgi:uncharacterized protein (UPF0276 family)